MIYDLAIIGAGPAGLMAAISALGLGAKVIILEKNKRAGTKLLLSGGGRCNFTNHIIDPKLMASLYLPNKQFLISTFSKFGVEETINFFRFQGLETKTEANGRVFPKSDRALDVLNILLKTIKLQGGELRINSSVTKIEMNKKAISKIILVSGEEIVAKNYLISTGGKSYPATGTTGDAYQWLRKIGHTVITPRPALAPLFFKEKIVKELEGLSLSNINLSLFENQKKVSEFQGDIIFTSRGISGPAALSLSRSINLNANNKYRVELNSFPEKSNQELESELQKRFHNGNKLFKTILESITSPKFTPVLMSLLEINIDRLANSINKVEKNKLVNLLSRFPFTISSLGSFEQAMVTAGGVDLKEIDPKTMKSKLISNLYLAGEIIDLTGPSGGFNLQLCWSTGHTAGQAAVDKNIDS